SQEERQKRGIDTLPGSLWEAIQLTEESEVVREALGDHVFDAFIKNKKIEWDLYRAQVTDYELKKYLPVL
ncbi:MAG: glutamine synthetase, partial [Dehalococcoidia bacterium]|nr:glutamine synthetase [Dehalococcoidia bacterium]